VTILVQLDEPKNGYYGGDVCAPYFKNIAQEVLLQLRVPPDTNLTLPEFNPKIADAASEDFLPDAVPIEPLGFPETNPPAEDNPEVLTVHVEGEWVVMPDFRGLSKRSVLNRCIDLGIQLQSAGSGIAIFQSPPPGTEIPVGTVCSVTFAKADLKGNVAALETQPAFPQAGPSRASSSTP
jgi:hypothetical protein